MNLISLLKNYKTVFEPFNIYWFPEYRALNIRDPRPYIYKDDINESLYEYISSVFRGRIINRNTYFEITLKEFSKRLFSRDLVIKFVRANRILPWISKNFSLRGTYLILRHPCATISSQIKTGWIGYPEEIEKGIREGKPALNTIKKIIIEEVKPIKEIDVEKVIKIVKNSSSIIELLAIEWSIDYLIPLHYLHRFNWYLLIYENLLIDRENEVKRIFKYIGEDPPNNIWKFISKPSKTTSEKIIKPENQMIKWKKTLNERQIKEIERITSVLDVNIYDYETGMPKEDLKISKGGLNAK